jgi:hypothetical protein
MKKLLFCFMIMLGMSFASCGHSSSEATDSVDSTEVVTDSVADTLVVDTVAVDSIL